MPAASQEMATMFSEIQDLCLEPGLDPNVTHEYNVYVINCVFS